jgi:hypothetical protein
MPQYKRANVPNCWNNCLYHKNHKEQNLISWKTKGHIVGNKIFNHLEQWFLPFATNIEITWNKNLYAVEQTIVGNCRNKKLYHWEQIFSSEGTYI